MAQTVLITLTTAGADTGPFDLYSNIDGFTVPFENNVAKLDLEAGYTSVVVPDSATTIRVQSDNVLCDNYIDLAIITTTTSTSTTTTTSTSTTSTSTSTTTSTSSTTTTTTTEAPVTIVNISNSASAPDNLVLTNMTVSGGQIFTVTSGAWPLDVGESLIGEIDGVGTFDLTVSLTVGAITVAKKLTVTDSAFTPTCEDITASGAYVFNNIVCNDITSVTVLAQDGVC